MEEGKNINISITIEFTLLIPGEVSDVQLIEGGGEKGVEDDIEANPNNNIFWSIEIYFSIQNVYSETE